MVSASSPNAMIEAYKAEAQAAAKECGLQIYETAALSPIEYAKQVRTALQSLPPSSPVVQKHIALFGALDTQYEGMAIPQAVQQVKERVEKPEVTVLKAVENINAGKPVQITEQMKQKLQGVTHVDGLDLGTVDANKLPEVIQFLKTNCPRLQSLTFAFSAAITPEVVRSLSAFEKLEKLTFYNCSIDDNGVKELGKFKNLRELTLTGSENITGATFKSLPRTLETLTLRGCFKLTDDGLGNLEGMSLKVLDLMSNYIKGTTFNKLPRTIEMLILSICPNVSDDALGHLQGMSLKELILNDNAIITGKTFDKLPSSIQRLVLSYCPKLTDAVVPHLDGRKLGELDVRFTGITERDRFKHIPRFLFT